MGRRAVSSSMSKVKGADHWQMRSVGSDEELVTI